MASGSGSRAGTGKKNTSSSRAGNTSTKKSAGSRKTSGSRKTNTSDGLTSEVILIGVFALLVLLFLCNFGIIGAVGNVVSGCMFGIFGMIAYVVPVLAGIGLAFGLANRGNRTAMMKISAGVVLMALVGVALELIGGQVPSMEKYSISLLYTVSAESKTGGGVFSGSLAYLLDHFLGMVGAVLLVLVLAIICMVIITEKSFVGGVKTRSRRVYESAREDARVRKERSRQRREEMEARREEERIRREEEESRKDAEKILRMDKRVSGVIMDTSLSAGEQMEERKAPAAEKKRPQKSRQEAPVTKPESDETPAPVASESDNIVDFDRIRIHTSTGNVAKEERTGFPDSSGRPVSAEGKFSLQTGSRTGGNVGEEAARTGQVERTEGIPADRSSVITDPGMSDDPLAKTYEDADVFRDMKMITRGGLAAAAGSAVISGEEFAAAGDMLSESGIAPAVVRAQTAIHETAYEALPEDFSLRAVAAPVAETVSVTARSSAPATRMDAGAGAKEPPEEENAENPMEENPVEEISQTAALETGRREEMARSSDETPEAFSAEEFSDESLSDPQIESSDEEVISEYIRPEQLHAESFREEPERIQQAAHPETRPEHPISAGPAAQTAAAARPVARPASDRADAQKLGAGNMVASCPLIPARPYQYPPLSLLRRMDSGNSPDALRELKNTAVKLQQTLATFGVKVTITDISQGPAITRYELQPEQGVKVSKIIGLADDIKLNLAATDIRIEAPIPGKAAVGIEVPNKESTMVGLRELLESGEFREFPSKIAFAVGKDIAGKVVVSDIAKMPHMLIAGSTGSGKSVCINTLIMSILYKAKPDEVKLILIDPKVVELSIYNGIPHLLIPVVSDPKQASSALHWGVAEMTDRYQKFADMNVRDLKGYNRKASELQKRGEPDSPEVLPQIVIIVDELADLMMVAPGEVEESICRLAQLARAAGIHLIIATQRPSVDVITGLIKANMPSRAAFAVSSGVDSRTILDMNGAEKLLGKGDMLFYPQGYPKPARVQGAFVSDKEVSDVVDYLKNQVIGNVYDDRIIEKVKTMEGGGAGGAAGGAELDDYFEKAARFIIDKDKASIGMLQRVFKIGFNRAARIMDQLADAGVVGEEEGTKPRKVLMSEEQFEQYMEEYM